MCSRLLLGFLALGRFPLSKKSTQLFYPKIVVCDCVLCHIVCVDVFSLLWLMTSSPEPWSGSDCYFGFVHVGDK